MLNLKYASHTWKTCGAARRDLAQATIRQSAAEAQAMPEQMAKAIAVTQAYGTQIHRYMRPLGLGFSHDPESKVAG